MKNTVPVLCLFLGIILCKTPYTLQECSRPDLNSNVVIDPDKATYTTWSLVSYSCVDEHSYRGPAYSYCYTLYDGHPDFWSPAPTGTCSEPCSVPDVDDDVIVSPIKDSYDTGDVVLFSCSNGTSLKGSDQGTCKIDGTWNINTNPQCLDMCPSPANSNGTGSYDHSATVIFSCDAGYQFDGLDETTESICDGGSWNPAVECKFGGCFPPDTPSNVNYTSVDPLAEDALHAVDSKITLMCADDMTPFGPEFSYCNSSGDWEPSPLRLQCFAKCEAPSFEDPRIVHASDRTGVNEDSYDNADTIGFTCEGRFVEGPRKSTCHEGVWSPDVRYIQPRCKNNCTAPENADIESDGAVFLHGHVEIFTCVSEPGMVRLGGPRAFCNDGKWKPNVLCKYETEL